MKHTVTLRNGDQVPALGIGTWYLGEDRTKRKQELESLKEGVHAGMTLIDTAEMYGSGKAELLVKEAMRESLKEMKREELYLVSKVLPNHAGKGRIETALDNTLMRMGVEQLDLYLYHWRGSYPLEETVAEFERVKKAGKIKEWGVSNFDIDDMEELWETPGGQNCLVNQVLYHTGSRGIEYSLLPWMREHEVALMSYCPLAQAGTLKRGLMTHPVLVGLAEKYNATVEQIMLAWNIRDGYTIAIPRSGKAEHTLQNAGADLITLSEEDYQAIDRAFPKPVRKEYLDMQ